MKNALASMEAVLLLALLLVTSSSICALQVFYVGSTTECSSADNSPCHSLQYYANNSNFTNNSIFHFMQGQHHLETVITIRNVVNLKLVGASSGVEIICNSPQSGLTVEEFRNLSVEYLTFSECSHRPNVFAVVLDTGSELSLNHVTISKTSSDSEYTGLSVNNVTKSFSIRSSVFYTPMGNGIKVQYPLSNRHSYFEFSGNEVSSCNKENVYGLYIGVDTPSLQIVLTGSNFKLGDSTAKDNICSLLVNFTVAANNSFNISNSSFMGKISLDIHYPKSNEITELNAFNFTTVLIEDSHLVNLTPTSSLQTRTVSWISLRNTTITNKKGTGVLINNWNVVFENCTFRENAKSAIIDISFSKQHHITFQGCNIFQNNSGLVGGALQIVMLIATKVYLQPNATILFENNHADYVGGAIYIFEYETRNECFYNIYFNTTAKMVFINNTASYGGSSLYGDGLAPCSTYNQVIKLMLTTLKKTLQLLLMENPIVCVSVNRTSTSQTVLDLIGITL